MNAAAFRHLYSYHFAQNHKIWDALATQLSPAQFAQQFTYSRGSVREQFLHLIEAEETWFCELIYQWPSEPLPAPDGDDRPALRAYADRVEGMIRAYLDKLTDEMLFTTPIRYPEEDQHLIVWQVLLHVVNHATDHRAQLLRQLNDLGLATEAQDYIFYIYDHPLEHNA